MTCTPFNTHNDLLHDSFDRTDLSSLYAPTPGYHIPQTPSGFSSFSPDHTPNDNFSPRHQSSQLNQISLLQLAEWEEGNPYDEQPPTCLHYWIVWRVTLNKKVVRKNTEQDLVLAPQFHWRLFLEPKLKELVGKKFSQKKVELDDTTIVVSVNHRTQDDLTLSFDQTDIDWPAVEKQLLAWGDLFRTGKKLTLNISFNFVESNRGSKFGLNATDKRGASSVTQRMLIQSIAKTASTPKTALLLPGPAAKALAQAL